MIGAPHGWRSVEWMLYRWGAHWCQFYEFNRDLWSLRMGTFWVLASGMIPR